MLVNSQNCAYCRIINLSLIKSQRKSRTVILTLAIYAPLKVVRQHKMGMKEAREKRKTTLRMRMCCTKQMLCRTNDFWITMT